MASNITTLADFRNLLKRNCGYPVIELEIPDENINDVVNFCSSVYHKYDVGTATIEDYLVFTVTSGTSAYSLSGDNIEAVVDIDLSLAQDNINAILTTQHNLLYDAIYSINFGNNTGMGSQGNMSLTSWEIISQYTDDIENFFGKKYRLKYSTATQELRFFPTPDENLVGLINVFKRVDTSKLYNDPLFQDLCTGQLMIRLGRIYRKYSMTFPGGGTINWNEIFQEGKELYDSSVEKIFAESEDPGDGIWIA